MFWKKKKETGSWIRDFIEHIGISKINKRIDQLEKQVKQLECSHGFRFDGYKEQLTLMSDMFYVLFKCSECGKTRLRRWERLTKKEQQAFKTLTLVPDYWEVKTK
jgi:RNase P subunit RPR2